MGTGSDLNRLLERAGGPAPCQISIPKPVVGDTLDRTVRRVLWGALAAQIR
jgi:hypothetical protein